MFEVCVYFWKIGVWFFFNYVLYVLYVWASVGACVKSSKMSWLFSLVQVTQYCDSVDPIWCSWFLNSVLPILRRESVSAVSLPMYLDCRFFLDCFMCCEVIVLSLIFDLQFAGEWMSFAVIFVEVKICIFQSLF